MTCIALLLRPHEPAAPRSKITTLATTIPSAVSLICGTACSDHPSKSTYSAAQAKIGESLAPLGWNVKVAEFRWSRKFVLVDIEAAASTVPDLAGPAAVVPHAKPDDIRFGPCCTLAHPVETTGLGSCDLNPACAAYGLSVLNLPDASLDAVHVNASLCAQGEINDALPNATVSVIGTHAALWVTRD